MLNRPPRSLPDYVELRCCSNFTFLRGASHPDELVQRAAELGYRGLAITDECSMAGVVRAHVAAKAAGLPLLLGSQFRIDPRDDAESSITLVVLAQDLHGYGNLCAFITKLRRASEKGTYHLTLDNITGAELESCVVLLCPGRNATDAQLAAAGRWTLNQFTGRCWIGVEQLRRIDDELWLHRMRQLSELTALPLVAAGDVHMHVRSRKPLQDVLTATRVGKPLTECGHALQRSAEQHLRTRLRLAQTFPPSCWRKLCRSPRAAASAWTNCATSIRTRSYRRGPPRRATCGKPHTRGQGAGGPQAYPSRCTPRSSTSCR